MKVVKVKIQNVMGIENLEFNAGNLTVIKGKNGVGKTSVIEALKSVFKGGHDATLIRKGESEAEVVILFDNQYSLRKSIMPDKAKLSFTNDKGFEINKAQTSLNSLFDNITLNPIEFIRADDKKRLDLLLASIEARLEKSEILDMLGDLYNNYKVDNYIHEHAVKVLELLYGFVYDERTGENRILKEKEALAKELKATLNGHLEAEPVDYGVEIQKLKSQIREIIEEKGTKISQNDAQLHAEYERVRENCKARIKSIESQTAVDIAELKREFDAKVKAVENESEKIISVIQKELTDCLDETREKGKNFQLEVNEETSTKLLELERNLALTEERQRNNDLVMSQKNNYLATQKALSEASEKVQKQTSILNQIQSKKQQLLSNIPVAGLTVEGNKILVDAVPFDRLNTATQIKIAVQIAGLRAKDIGFLVCDGFESLDAESRIEFSKCLEENNLFAVVAEVTDDEEIQISEINNISQTNLKV